MTVHADEHERTMAFAEVALGQIRALRQSATPRNYEIWYTYATGYNPSLNQMINELLTRDGNLTEHDIDQIYETYFSPSRLSERIDKVGSRVAEEIDEIMGMIEAAAGSTSSYSESLADAKQQLGRVNDREGVRTIIQSLVESGQEMAQNNQKLEARLSASKQEINQLQENLEAVRTESLTDPLTTLSNRKYFDQALEREIAAAAAKNEPLSLLITDIDNFKSFNDRYGHLTGDHVLRLVAAACKQNVKGQDIAARYGGEEFVVLLPDTTLRSAVAVADQIRRSVMTKELIKRSTGEHLGRITISIGVATLHRGENAAVLIGRADSCLYAAKRSGRNRVVCETDPEVNINAETRVA
jgi:diguanylate cyclase